MAEILVFGGTTEGREIAEQLIKKQISSLVCVASEYGESLLESTDTLRVHTGRLDQHGMETLLAAERPRLVIDATHPYATAVSENIRAACVVANVRCLRVNRTFEGETDGYRSFPHMDALVDWLNTKPGVIFSTLGAKEAAALAKVSGFSERIWLRILPSVEGLTTCLNAGFSAKHIICMQGPFSEELNTVMFRVAKADILLTKESGAAGGFPEKLLSARACGMTVAVLARPAETEGLPLHDILQRIAEGTV